MHSIGKKMCVEPLELGGLGGAPGYATGEDQNVIDQQRMTSYKREIGVSSYMLVYSRISARGKEVVFSL
jgi:hypothetical protein